MLSTGFRTGWGLGSYDHVERLKRRSEGFLAHASIALDRGDFDLACFYAEQAAQLRLKALFLRMFGHIPRAHSIRALLGTLAGELAKMGKEASSRKITDFSRINRDSLRRLEEAYTGARYLPREFDESDARECIETAVMLMRVLDEVEESLFA